MSEVLARQVSPDGELVFLVERSVEPDGKVTIAFGFEGSDWHLHPDSFESAGRTPEQVAFDVFNDLVTDRFVIVMHVDEEPIGHYLLESIEMEIELYGVYAPHEFRLWSGRRLARYELLEGTAGYSPSNEVWVW